MELARLHIDIFSILNSEFASPADPEDQEIKFNPRHFQLEPNTDGGLQIKVQDKFWDEFCERYKNELVKPRSATTGCPAFPSIIKAVYDAYLEGLSRVAIAERRFIAA